MKTTRTASDGAWIYTRYLLACYDFLIFRVLSPYVWRCAPQHFIALYKTYMSANHADVGVGTGFILNQCEYTPGHVRIGLFDLQPASLAFTANRLARFQPDTVLCNALDPITSPDQGYDSVALGGLLHCIPGDMTEKASVFDSVKSLMRPGARLFGYTILNREIEKTRLSRCIYFVLYHLKVINGKEDSPCHLSAELSKRFKHVTVEVIGCVALFSATNSI